MSIIKLKDAFKTYTYDQDKVVSPEQTVLSFKARLESLHLDILSKTRRIDNKRLDIPVFFSECGIDAKKVIGTNKQMGKGGTIAQAQASAMMELAERFSFFSFMQNKENFLFRAAIKENDFDYRTIIKSVHDNDQDGFKAKKIFNNLPLRWTKAYNLTQEKEVFLPFDWFYMINEFNGTSAGNCTEEALNQGICELVERHVCAIVSEMKSNISGINLDSFSDPLVVEMLNKYKKQGINVYASDFSLDTKISSIGILAFDPISFPIKSEIVWTAGTSCDPQKAMSRALTETAQLAGDFNSNSNYVASGLPKFTKIKDAQFVINPDKMIDADELPDISDNNIKIEVQNLISLLKGKNLEVFSIDTMHKGLKVPAFYSIMPGAYFKERAQDSSVGMFCAKFITQKFEPVKALSLLGQLEEELSCKYYTSFYKGIMLAAVYDYESSVKEFESALSKNPARLNLPDIYSHMSSCLKESGQYGKSVEICEKALQIDEQRADILNTMGFCYFVQKEYKKAIKIFEKAITIDPSIGINYANIGSIYRELKQIDISIKYYEIALEIDPSIEFAKDNIKKLKKLN